MRQLVKLVLDASAHSVSYTQTHTLHSAVGQACSLGDAAFVGCCGGFCSGGFCAVPAVINKLELPVVRTDIPPVTAFAAQQPNSFVQV